MWNTKSKPVGRNRQNTIQLSTCFRAYKYSGCCHATDGAGGVFRTLQCATAAMPLHSWQLLLCDML